MKRHFFSFRILRLCVFLSLCTLPLQAKHTFRVQIDDQNQIEREVDLFEVETAGQGYAILKLSPDQPDLERSQLQLGSKKKYGEVPISGEALWLAYVKESKRVVARLSSVMSEEEIPAGTVVLSARPDTKAASPVDGALEAADALVKLGFRDDALVLLQTYSEDARYSDSRCRLLKALLDLQTPPPSPEGGIFSPTAEQSLRRLLTDCSGVEAEAASRLLADRTTQRVEFILKAEDPKGLPDPRDLVRDALELINDRPGADQLYLALARVHEQFGDTEAGTKVLEQFFKTYSGPSPYKDEARRLQEALARRAPASGYKGLGGLDPQRVRKYLEIKKITDLAFDAEGHLLVLDGKSKPRSIHVMEIDTEYRKVRPLEVIPVPSMEWDPIAVERGKNGVFYLADADGDQLASFDTSVDPPETQLFPKRHEDWKLRSIKKIGVVLNEEILVLDPSSEAIHRYAVDGRHLGLIDLENANLENALDIAAAPDGSAMVATKREFSVFTPIDGPKSILEAKRGLNHRLKIGGIEADRWHYVYLFDRATRRLEKFRRNGEWLTTVVDCKKEGIRDPRLWAVSREGDIVIYDGKTDQFYFFTQ